MQIFIAGDSTAAAKSADARPETGWGEYLEAELASNGITAQVRNHAINGRSTRSFIAEGRLEEISSRLEPGDFLLVQFGHNDQKLEDPERGTTPWQEYPRFLTRYIEVARQAQATAVLATSITRRDWLEAGDDFQLNPDTLGDYPASMRELAASEGVALLDMFAVTQDLIRQVGTEGSEQLFLHLEPSEHPNYPQGVTDNTHLRPHGAQKIAQLVAAHLSPLIRNGANNDLSS